MTQVTVELNDTLQDCVNGAIDETKTALIEWLEENTGYDPELNDAVCLSGDIDYNGRFHEIVDGAVPFYTREIETAWFLHGDDLEEAYENAGIGGNCRENNGMSAIYCYIEQQVSEWYQENNEEITEEFFNEKIEVAKESIKDAFEGWIIQEFESKDILDLDLYDLGFESDFDYVMEQAENYLGELKDLNRGDFEIDDLVRFKENDTMIYKVVQLGKAHSCQGIGRVRIKATQCRSTHSLIPFWTCKSSLKFA